jgi:acylphosphatase
MLRRVHAIVSGRVQGVSFRATTCHEARRLRLVGWVRNLSDGTVELEAEGPDEQVAALLAWCEHGPPAARVERVEVTNIPPVDRERAFEIS